MIWLVLAVMALALFALYLSSTAGRLDRLHHRVDAGLAALDIQLTRRSALVMKLATSGYLDPAASMVLADAAQAAQVPGQGPIARAQAESDLTKVLCAAFASEDDIEALAQPPGGAEFVDGLADAVHRAAMSRRFYNDAVRACRAVRRHRLVRWLRLAGSAPWPRFVEMDDSIPAGFIGR